MVSDRDPCIYYITKGDLTCFYLQVQLPDVDLSDMSVFENAINTTIYGGFFYAIQGPGNTGMCQVLGNIYTTHPNHKSHYGIHERDARRCDTLLNIDILPSPAIIFAF